MWCDAVVFWPVVAIDYQCRNMGAAFTDGFSPLRYAVGQTIACDFGEDVREKDVLRGRGQNANGGTRGAGLQIVITGDDLDAASVAACEGADVDRRFGIERNALDVWNCIGLTIDLSYVRNDGIGARIFFVAY